MIFLEKQRYLLKTQKLDLKLKEAKNKTTQYSTGMIRVSESISKTLTKLLYFLHTYSTILKFQVRSARNLLSAVARLLILADMIDVHMLLMKLQRVEDDLEVLKSASSQAELIEGMERFGDSAHELMTQVSLFQVKNCQENNVLLQD